MPEFLWDDGAALIMDARAEGPRSPVAFQVSGNKRKCGAGFWGLCEDSSPERGHPVRMSRRASVVGAGVAQPSWTKPEDKKPPEKKEKRYKESCLIPLITYVVQKMPIMTMPTHPESETMEKRQKMMVLRTIKEDKNPEKAFKIYERFQYAKSTEVQKLKPNTDEEANPAEEEDEEVWEDGDSGHRRLGEAQLQHILSGKGHKRSTELNPSLNASSED
ncbi:hypothetical protein DUI87_15380 [Hirundo rustica rustica]|uniref:Uncharacterized protein n=1 Tax=Hirundo rustica rustica TaxID=333673 RepID=A0A3M0K3P4_HIRRU|nr:hypothetical protein DUI87_15380 [Hirundo rustica rustica]